VLLPGELAGSNIALCGDSKLNMTGSTRYKPGARAGKGGIQVMKDKQRALELMASKLALFMYNVRMIRVCVLCACVL
jgi:hypothetical protein